MRISPESGCDPNKAPPPGKTRLRTGLTGLFFRDRILLPCCIRDRAAGSGKLRQRAVQQFAQAWVESAQAFQVPAWAKAPWNQRDRVGVQD